MSEVHDDSGIQVLYVTLELGGYLAKIDLHIPSFVKDDNLLVRRLMLTAMAEATAVTLAEMASVPSASPRRANFFVDAELGFISSTNSPAQFSATMRI